MNIPENITENTPPSNVSENVNISSDTVRKKSDPEDILRKLTLNNSKYVFNNQSSPQNKLNSIYTNYIQESTQKGTQESTKKSIQTNDLENVSDVTQNNTQKDTHIIQFKSMISNALRIHNDIVHNIKDNVSYCFSMKFVMENNKVTINDLDITEKFIDPEETPLSNKYDEYDALTCSSNTLGSIIKRKIDNVKTNLNRKKSKSI